MRRARERVAERDGQYVRDVISTSLIWAIRNPNERASVVKHTLRTLDNAGLTIVSKEMLEQLRTSYDAAQQRYYTVDDQLTQLKMALHNILYGEQTETTDQLQPD